jgi:sulfite reductase beta subunit-like hemoprotein
MSGRDPSVRPNIPRAKRDGLELDLDAVCAAGPGALGPDDHYRLKTYGVCPQRDDDRFMVRLRVAAGTLDVAQAETLTQVAHDHAGGWVHLTTRQNVELHSVNLATVPALYAGLAPTGLVGRSACGHTVRNVMACPDAATSAEEPFDVSVDAQWLSAQLVARSRDLNVALPNRLNITLGGCPSCGQEAMVNDIGLVACVRDGEPGYQVWAGGSLGTAPRLAILLRPFVARADLWAAVWAIVEWYLAEGDVEQVTKGRLKFVIEAKGESAFRNAFLKRFTTLRTAAELDDDLRPPPLTLPTNDAPVGVLGRAPTLGWREGIRPERRGGFATITVPVPLGDLPADDLLAVARLAPTGRIVLTREQNIVVPSVPLADVGAVTAALAELGLGPFGARGQVDVRACPGLAFCSLAITASQEVALEIERAVVARADLPREARIAVSGCPNSCAKQQVADLGFSGTKVKVDGEIGLGYQLFLGADLPAGLVGEPVLRLLEREVPAAVVAALELWATLRRPGETAGQTYRRLGLDVIAAALELRLRDAGFGDRPDACSDEPGPEQPTPVQIGAPTLVGVA